MAYQVELLEDRTLLTAAFPEFIDPNPSADNGFGDTVVALSTGNVVITAPYDDAGGTNAGAVYLFDGATKELISTLRGSTNNDKVGIGSITTLSNGNYVVNSLLWNNGAATNAGAVTFGNGTTGVSGVVSAANSLVGTSTYDKVGSYGVIGLSNNGNYLVSSADWDNKLIENVGAVTFGNGNTGVIGEVSAANSLVGTSANDKVGSGGIKMLSNDNYLVSSAKWSNGAATNAGAVTFGNGSTGIIGEVSAANSLVGSTSFDQVGNEGATVLSNGNYVISSRFWDNGAATNAGAVTFGNGTTGVSGVVSAANSLVGTSTDDKVGSDKVGSYGVIELSNNGNYLVRSVDWNRSSGAVTFGDGTTGVSGVVSAANSLVGGFRDKVGNGGVTVLLNGNYVVSSVSWNNGAATNAGAVTFGNGTTGVSGVVSAANSLVGSTEYDSVGGGYYGVRALSNGNYVVSSYRWDNGSVEDVGAVTFGNGTTGVKGVISKTNSLVGSTEDDHVGSKGVTALPNGNYVVSSSLWDNGSITNVGAATFGNGTTGVKGVISETNSLVGSTRGDRVGNRSVTVLSNGNYVVRSSNWANDVAIHVGAVTFGDGNTGVIGTVSAANSLVGSSAFDGVGGSGVTALSNGNYVVHSSDWDNGMAEDAGAVTFGNGTTGVSGVVSAANSLVGSTSFDQVGNEGVTALSNGNYVVRSSDWDNGTAEDAGAVTFGNRNTGVSGVVSATNSLVGETAFDEVGSGGVTALSNGNYVVSSGNWDNSLAENASAVTFGNGNTGVTGVVSAANSLVGETAFDDVGSGGVTELSSGNYVVRSLHWDNDGITNAGAVTFGDGNTGVSGVISATNSVVGSEDSGYSGIPTALPKALEIIPDDINNTFYVILENEGEVWIGSQVDGILPRILDVINDVKINENASEQNVFLTGISASGFIANQLRVTATSSNTGLIPDPAVYYSSPDDTGSLTFTPMANQAGIATITVTVEDGGLDGDLSTTGDNFMSQRTFDIIVSALVDIDLRVVNSPTNVQPNDEVSVLPDHQNEVHEWSTFWLEIWVKTTSVASQGIFSINLFLDYHTEYISATSIEFGSGFTQNQTGTINDFFGGVIYDFAAETNVSNLGVSEYLLFARVKYESLENDRIDLDLANKVIGPYDLGFSVRTAEVESVAGIPAEANINLFQGTSIWANPFDLNDDDSVNFRDLMLFASVYREKPSESSNDYSWFSDFDQNDRVNFRDLMLFASNYRKSKANNSDVNYPSNYPDAWDNSLRVILEPQTKIKTTSLTQAEADQILNKAIEQASEQLTPEMNQALSGVEVKVVDLPGATLGRAVPGTIYLDVSAAGYGWFVDTTPLDHSEFEFDSQLSLIALPESAAAGRIDLWTMILHELGHLAGYEHEAEGLLEETLAPGIRKLADWEETTDLFFASVQEEAELLAF